MRKGHLITILIFGAMLAVFAASTYSGIAGKQHGDRELWLKKHAETIRNNGNPKGFCLDCHQKKRKENVENFCNKCHAKMGIPAVDINKLQKRG